MWKIDNYTCFYLQAFLIPFLFTTGFEVNGNPISNISSFASPYDTVEPCIIDYKNQCVPNNKCSYMPVGFTCKIYGTPVQECQLICDETFCVTGKCGCNNMVLELSNNYSKKHKLFPSPPSTCTSGGHKLLNKQSVSKQSANRQSTNRVIHETKWNSTHNFIIAISSVWLA